MTVYLLGALASYLLGAFPTGLLVGRWLRGVDIREYGSGKTGTTNTLRTLGRGPAVLVLVIDLLKGAAPVLVARAVSDDSLLAVFWGLAAIAGHDWPVYVGFRGGRGVATSFGAATALQPLAGLVMLLIAVLLLLPTRIVSLMSLGGAVSGGLIFIGLALAGRAPAADGVFGLLAGGLVVLLHRENIGRLLAGTEPKIGQGGSRRTPPTKGLAPGGR